MSEKELMSLIPISENPKSLNQDGTKQYTCNRCGRVFSQMNGPSGVKQHLVQVHVENGELQTRVAENPGPSKKRKAPNLIEEQSKKPNLESKNHVSDEIIGRFG